MRDIQVHGILVPGVLCAVCAAIAAVLLVAAGHGAGIWRLSRADLRVLATVAVPCFGLLGALAAHDLARARRALASPTVRRRLMRLRARYDVP